MAPAQLCVGNYQGSTQHSKTKVPVGQKNMGLLKKTGNKGLRCITNCEDAMSGMEAFLQKHTKVPELPNNEAVDIIECSNTNIRLAETEDPDATEYSSSFGGTVSETGDGFSEAEVESPFLGDNNLASSFDPFTDVFAMRKKKVSSHWRKFIRPLMWRCKWTELRINELKSRASIYARKLAAYDQVKMELNQSTIEGFASKSMPISSQHGRKNAMKRRKRKRVEDVCDAALYMSRHNLFSFIENKKSNPDGTSVADDFGNPVFTDQNAPRNNEFGVDDIQAFLELSGGENSLEWILWKIEKTSSRIQNLKTQLGTVLLEHAGKFSSWETLSLLGASDGSASSPTLSAGNSDTISMGAIYPSTMDTQHIPEYDRGDNMRDLIFPENYGEANHIPDVIESTVGLLSAADVTMPHPQIGDSCETIVDTERHELKRGEQEESSKAKTTISRQESTLESSLAFEYKFPKNKRKRGERKAGPGAWSFKNSADPDS